MLAGPGRVRLRAAPGYSGESAEPAEWGVSLPPRRRGGPAAVAFHLFFLVTSVAAVVTRREWYHKLLAIVSVTAFGFYIAMLFARLR